MNNKKEIFDLVKLHYNEYKNVHNLILPDIDDIKIEDVRGYFARFYTDDLYNKKYILHINENLLAKNPIYFKQTMFHEFTHLADSIDFLHYTKRTFKSIMSTFSEFHAAKCEMTERLKDINSNEISLQSIIIHIGELTIESFMEQTLGFVIADFERFDKNQDLDNIGFNPRHLYYYIGHIGALKDKGLKWDYKFYKLPSTFLSVCTNIADVLLLEPTHYNEILQTYINLVKAVNAKCHVNADKARRTRE